eukprot:1604597-Prymnesium_polylepis.1
MHLTGSRDHRVEAVETFGGGRDARAPHHAGPQGPAFQCQSPRRTADGGGQSGVSAGSQGLPRPFSVPHRGPV